MVDLTVAIPTYNGAERLPPLLAQLQAQQGGLAGAWEIWVVDNNSTDHTLAVVQQFQATWTGQGRLQWVQEPRPGTAYARQRAIEVAQGQWVGFLDDDTVPALDWVAAAIAFGQAHPQAGAFNGRVRGQFAGVLPQGFDRIAPYLAIVERGDQAHRYESRERLLPPGAGLVVQRAAWLQTVPSELVLNHVGVLSPVASEDLEAVLHLQQGGWEVWYAPTLTIDHHIPAWRLEPDYLLQLARRVALSRHRLRMLRGAPWQRPGLTVLYWLNDLRRYLVQRCRPCPPEVAMSVWACETEALRCSLLSPWFVWTRRWQHHRDRSIAPTSSPALPTPVKSSVDL